MSDPADYPLENILKHCAARAPEPWYPQADGLGLPRDRLDPLLDELRLGGLVRLTDWVQGKGQGYALTPAGAEAMRNSAVMARLRRGEVPAPKLPKQDELPERASLTFRRGQDIRKAIESSDRPVVTLTLLYLNIAMFVLGCFLSWQRLGSAEPFLMGKAAAEDVLRDTGLISAPAIFPGQQWWRLLACCFVHIGFLHLLMNMVMLWMFGRLLESLWGRWNYLAIYLVSGLCASFTVVAFGKAAAGASGALWGLIASLGVWYFLNRKALDPAALRSRARNLFILVVLNVIFTLQVPGISAEGHFGGGLAGLLAAFPVDYARYHPGWRRYLALAALPFLLVAFFSFFLQNYAASHHLPVIREADEEARQTLLRNNLQRLINTAPAERQIDGQMLAKIDAARNELRTAYAVRWVRYFNRPELLERIDAGNDMLAAWLALYDDLHRFAGAPQQWSAADEEGLKEHARQLIQVRNRYQELAPHG